MAEKSKQSAKSTNKFKFVKLAEGNVIWKDPESGFMLNALAKQEYSNLDNVPTKAKAAMEKAVKAGLLVYTSNPEETVATKHTKENKPLVTKAPTRTKWTDEDNNENFKKSPSFSNRNRAIDSDNPIVQQAFKLLAAAPAQAIDKMAETLAALNDNEKEVFLKACVKVEKSGNNTAAKPRTQVMDYLRKTAVDLGFSTGVGNVQTQEEPIVNDKKPVKFDL